MRKVLKFVICVLIIVGLTACTKNNYQKISLDEPAKMVNRVYDDELKNIKKSNCLNSPLPDTEYSEEFLKYKNELETLFKNSSLNFSYYYEDITTGYSNSYNADSPSFAASVIKAPVDVYIYTLASKGEIDLDEKLTYTSNFYSGGTGIIQYNNSGTTYSIRTLVEYSVKYSDNIAHKMLVNRFGMNNIRDYFRSLGSKAIFENGNLFSNITAHDGYISMNELYKLYLDNDYGKELMGFFKEAQPNFITGDGSIVAHKYGWASDSLHDMAIVFDDNPYILIVFTNRGYTEYENFFDNVSSLVNKMHKAYNLSKNNYCETV